jgi:hypothetical protein
MKADRDMIDRRAFIGFASVAGAAVVHGSARVSNQLDNIIRNDDPTGNDHPGVPGMSLVSIAKGWEGSGEAPKYRLNAEGRLEQRKKGNLYAHQDGMLGFSHLQPGIVDQFDAFLETGGYEITADAIPMRVPGSVVGRRPGFGNPNG